SLSISLDVVQEHRAESAAEALRRSVAIHADVLRDGKWASLPVDLVVPGDVIQLRAGDLVPADGILLDGRSVHVNEALMTGEPFPVEKRAGVCDAGEPADALNALFAGTSVVSGEAVILAVTTGAATRFGGIAAALSDTEPPSAFERGIHRLALLILRLTIFLVLIVLLVNVAFGRPVIESFLFAVALAVGLTPELLPMVTTVTLSRGAVRMARKNVVVKRLAAIHDLGAMDVLCTDKTGTLTEATITLAGHPGTDGGDSGKVLTLAAVNSGFSAGIRSPLDQAIIAQAAGTSPDGWRKIDEIPFDFERRCVSVLAEQVGKRVLILKGAPEDVLARANRLECGDASLRPLDATAQAALEQRHREYAAQGYRALAIAWKEMPAALDKIDTADERDLVLAGFCLFVDPPKASAAAAIARLANAGVRVKVISGDHPAVVRHLVESLKIHGRKMLTGAEIARLSDSALAARVPSTDLFARVSPDQKTRIIRALQARGHTVGFIGDGVNDAPAIRAAEVGLSVDGATDVARSAADIILLSPDLGVVADGVAEGRRTFANILKYVRIGNELELRQHAVDGAGLAGAPVSAAAADQILLNNLLYDLSEVGIRFERVDRRPGAASCLGHERHLAVHPHYGNSVTLFDLATFAVLLIFRADTAQFRTAWFVESMLTQILVIFVIRTYGAAWASRAHPALVASSIAGLAIAIVLAATPLGAAFAFIVIPWPIVGSIVALVALYLASAEGLKQLANARPHRRPAGDVGDYR
ncbi:MAG TPA: magnesium-translocating P-type ATPase, partial [Pseudolabrys sp.]|nr:magnesium-translocating P-type ATPase [Pseudolabrys sp.]